MIHYLKDTAVFCGHPYARKFTTCLNDVSCDRCFDRICRRLDAPGIVAGASPTT